MAEAEVRALYFGDLASRYARRKQWIVAVAFVLSSGAAITALGQATPIWFPGILGLAVAALTGYSIGFNLDDRVLALARLHSGWNHLADDYERLWNRWYEGDAERFLLELQRRARELSESGTKAPYQQERIEYWEQHVFSRYSDPTASRDRAVVEAT